MIIYFLEKPQKKIINIYFNKVNILNKKKFGKKILHYSQIKKKNINKKHTLIFSFNIFSEFKKFQKKIVSFNLNKNSIYMIYNISKSFWVDKILILTSIIFLNKMKNIIIFHNDFTNSLMPDFLYQIRFKSLIKSAFYFIYQLAKNMLMISKSNMILIKKENL